jgi:tRNA(adenine34) deaminase
VLARRHNERELRGDPTAHAEILAMRDAAAALGSWRLAGMTLVVTLEPCPMCAGAMVQARIARCVYGARDPKKGADGSVYDVLRNPRNNHLPFVVSGVMEPQCAEVLRQFFRALRVR